MAMVRSSPTQELASLHSSMDRLFTDMFGDAFRSPRMEDTSATDIATYHLPLNVVRADNSYRIEAPLPGWSPADIEVTFSEGTLSINAKRSETRSRKEGRYLRREVVSGNLTRQITIPSQVRPEDIKASFENGMLTIEVAMSREPKPAQIRIQASEQSKSLTRAGSSKNAGRER